MTAFDFIRWCFRDRDSGVMTVILAWLLCSGLCDVAKALRGRK